MVKTYNSNIIVFGDNEERANISIEQDRLDLYDSADEFVEEMKEDYPWISDRDLEKIFIAIALRF